MVRIHGCLLLCALVLAPLTSWTQPVDDRSEMGLTDHLVQSASDPADHEALARHFRMEADKLRMMALAHRSMGDSYRRSKLRKAERQKEHCERIAALEEQISQEYEQLSKAHEAELSR